MAKYTIRPLKVGSLMYYRGAFTSNQEHYKEREEFPILSFLIEGNGRKILVDTGGGDPDSEAMKAAGHAKCYRKPEEAPDQALLALGVHPKEIDTVIITHLHWDHCYNNHLFPQADFYIQKAEMLEAVCPLPSFMGTYESFETGVVPPWARQGTKWKLVEGEYDLCDGIRLVPLPGHTSGLQGVLVDTIDGMYLLPSDCVPLYDCIAGLSQGKFAISSLCVDLAAFCRSFEWMKELQEKQGIRILASHDSLTLEQDIYPKISE